MVALDTERMVVETQRLSDEHIRIRSRPSKSSASDGLCKSAEDGNRVSTDDGISPAQTRCY